jgi:hypothetical protein
MPTATSKPHGDEYAQPKALSSGGYSIGHARRAHIASRLVLTDSAPGGGGMVSMTSCTLSMQDLMIEVARRADMPQDAASLVRSSTVIVSIETVSASSR